MTDKIVCPECHVEALGVDEVDIYPNGLIVMLKCENCGKGFRGDLPLKDIYLWPPKEDQV
jgi:rubredoxin